MTDEELITYLELTLTYPVRVFPDGLEIRDCGTYRTKMDPSFPSVERDIIAMIRANDAGLPAIFDQVIEYFHSHGKDAFGVILSPRSTPASLRTYLAGRKAEPGKRYLGLAFPVEGKLEIDIDPRIEVREMMLADMTDDIAAMIDRAWGFPEGNTKQGLAKLKESDDGSPHPRRVCIAFYDGVPAAFSALELYDDLPVIRLGGGATDPAFRGKGIYRATILARQNIAREHGKQQLLVQALEDTSAPILKRLGFRELCVLEQFSMKIS
jgi:GNAT superfamily N-acetyltransferase